MYVVQVFLSRHQGRADQRMSSCSERGAGPIPSRCHPRSRAVASPRLDSCRPSILSPQAGVRELSGRYREQATASKSSNSRNNSTLLPSTAQSPPTMSTFARRALFQTRRAPLRTVPRRGYAEKKDIGGDPAGEKKVDLKEGAKRDPELYVCPIAADEPSTRRVSNIPLTRYISADPPRNHDWRRNPRRLALQQQPHLCLLPGQDLPGPGLGALEDRWRGRLPIPSAWRSVQEARCS